MEEARAPRAPRRSLKTAAWGAVVTLGAALLVSVGLPFTSVFFEAEQLETCTVTERPSTPRARRGGSLFPRVHTDCGVFRTSHRSGSLPRSTRQAPCTTDPALTTPLIPGYTYDLEVRGANLPFLTSREVVSATVSPQQKREPLVPIKPLEPTTDNELLNETIEEIQDRPENRRLQERLDQLEAEFSPEVLRAFDYEQPAFSPTCDVSRRVMTSKGLQLMDPPRAAEMLTPPPGEVAREPLLPCDGFQCEPLATR